MSDSTSGSADGHVTVIGAGIYVLLGEVVTSAGVLAPVSFLLAAILAGFSAFSFAELSARIPQSAGEALYVYEAFGSRAFSTLIGLLVVSVGCVACATLANGFVGYATSLFSLPPWILIVGFILCKIAMKGDGQGSKWSLKKRG